MQEKLYEDYAVLDAKIKALNNQKDELKAQILEDMIANEQKNVDTAVGKFAIASIKTWTYTDKVSELEERFKAQKAKEQSTGDATCEEKPSLRFSQVKL